jgi:3-hydroxybutyryl-CoA dehydratase
MKTGDVFKHSFKLSEEVYQGFIQLFQDRNILHTDASYARQKGYRDKVVQGNTLGGFISYFVGECLPVKNVIIYDQHIKFVKPVYIQDALQFQAEITGIFESVNTIEFKFHFQNQDQIKVAKGTLQVGLI